MKQAVPCPCGICILILICGDSWAILSGRCVLEKKKACQGVETGPARVQIIQQEALETRKAKFRYLAIGMDKRQADQG